MGGGGFRAMKRPQVGLPSSMLPARQKEPFFLRVQKCVELATFSGC